MGGTAAAAVETEEESGGGIPVDPSVGTIVWVRRRNGSWWPGRILGPEELPESMIMSPRTGTPVKLLGREDASVDWYNLEKSKRVKAFRCGEFDACIEKAEALQGNRTRKREKYARREDAILHALELERKQVDERNSHSSVLLKNVDGRSLNAFRRGLKRHSSEANNSSGHGKLLTNKTRVPSKREASLFAQDDASRYFDKVRSSKNPSSKDDNLESSTRTRGLQGFGRPIASSKKNLSQISTRESLQKSYDSSCDVLPGTSGQFVASLSHSGDGKNSSDIKRRRLQGGLSEGSLKRRDRRRPLNQVLLNSAKLPISNTYPDDGTGILPVQGRDSLGAVSRKRSHCVYHPADSDESVGDLGCSSEQLDATSLGMDDSLQHPDSSSEETETTLSGMIEMDDCSSSDREFSEPELPDVDDDSPGSGKHVIPSSSAFNVRDKLHKMKDEGMEYEPQLYSYDQSAYASGETGVSKWHMKGKRNIRNLAKRPVDIGDNRGVIASEKCNGSFEGSLNESSLRMSKKERTGFHRQRTSGSLPYSQSDEFDDDLFDDENGIDNNFDHKNPSQYSRTKFPLAFKCGADHRRSDSSFLDSEDDSIGLSSSVWEVDGSHAARRGYWGYSGLCADGVEDVVLKVQASNTGSSHGERQHVPLVSLMSRLNGKAIVGHPVQIEILEDGSTFQPAFRAGGFPDENNATAPTWRTARRTAMQRVPRANPVRSELQGEERASILQSTHYLKEGHSGRFYQESRFPKKSAYHKKSGKKVSLSNQKTKKLSSLASEQRHVENVDVLGGLIKRSGTVPLVTCVPVKVVFSRLLESIGRPPSNLAHQAVARDPS